MNQKISITNTTRRLVSIAAAALLTAVSTIACSGSPLQNTPFAPSAVPAMTLSAETGDGDAGATFGALDKGKEKKGPRGEDDADVPDAGEGDDSGEGDDAGDGDTDDGDTDDGDTDNGEDGRGNPHHGAGPHRGTVSSFRGACPAVTFNLKGLRVSTTEATEYLSASETGEAACEMLRPSVQVIVTGTAGTTSRTFVAETITIVRTH